MSKLPILTKDQECQRIEGLRILARIIARLYLAYPKLHPMPVEAEGDSKESGKERVE